MPRRSKSKPEMHLYIVRWPDLQATIIRARDETHLRDIIDEVGDPGGCSWQRYEGPLWIDFDIPAEVKLPDVGDDVPIALEQLQITVPPDLSVHPLLVPDVHGADTAWEMRDQVIKLAFPAVAALLDSLDVDQEEEPARADLVAALRRDLVPLIQHRWRKAQVERRTDPEAGLMRQLGVTESVPAMEHEPRGGDEE